jgi:ribosomal protein S18 acetylase RimI-like enzyme
VDALDNWVWRALTGPQAHLSEGSGEARRYEPTVSPFAAMPDEVTPAAWSALAELMAQDEVAVLFRAEVGPLPDGWAEMMRLPGLQMLGPPPGRPRPSGPDVDVELLTADDVPAMVELVGLTQPGPFEARTIELGTYLGVRDGSRLIAMAGQRMRLEGYTEISAVCTRSDHQGKGLAGVLVERLVEEIHRRGDVPFLHAASTNVMAISRYRSLGFTTRREVEAVAFTVIP